MAKTHDLIAAHVTADHSVRQTWLERLVHDAPVSGEVVEANADLEATPEKLNSDPHKSAWLIRVKLADQAELATLMDAKAYEAFISEKNKEASA